MSSCSTVHDRSKYELQICRNIYIKVNLKSQNPKAKSFAAIEVNDIELIPHVHTNKLVPVLIFQAMSNKNNRTTTLTMITIK
jgi:hypothetical protein